MEAFLDALAAYLATQSETSGIQWILGDFQMGSPEALPFGFITPFNDKVNPRSGVDMDDYTVPLFVVDDLQKYGDPVPVAGQQYLEQPGYRVLLQYAQSVRKVMRKPGGITLGNVAKTGISEIRYVPVVIDEKPYRAVRITITAQQRRART